MEGIEMNLEVANQLKVKFNNMETAFAVAKEKFVEMKEEFEQMQGFAESTEAPEPVVMGVENLIAGSENTINEVDTMEATRAALEGMLDAYIASQEEAPAEAPAE